MENYLTVRIKKNPLGKLNTIIPQEIKLLKEFKNPTRCHENFADFYMPQKFSFS